jgi:hypothetical protein
MPHRESPAGHNGASSGNQTSDIHCSPSSQVRWWDFHEWVQPFLDAAGEWPLVGSQPWFDLAYDDPAKWASLLDAAQHWALRIETCQQALADTSRDICAAADWKAIASEMLRRREVYIPREVAR